MVVKTVGDIGKLICKRVFSQKIVGVILLLSALLSPYDSLGWADTNVSGPVIVDTVWDLAGSPYIINSNVVIQGTDGVDGVTTLSISAGVEVRFGLSGQLSIGASSGAPGALSAVGTLAEPIIFTSQKETAAPGDWRGIFFYNTAQDGQCVLSHCEVGYAGAGSIGSVYAYYCHPEISHTRIHHSSSYGIYAQSANIVASDNEIDHNTSYGCYLAYGAPDISGTNFHDNTNFDIYYQSPTGGAVTGNTIRSGIRLNAGAISAFTGNTVEINDSYPAQMLADQVGDFLTANTLTGITPNSYLEVYGATITRDATWPAVLPLQMRSSVTVQGTDGDDGVTTLTIGAGTVIQFSQNLSLSIGANSGNPGALVAVGTTSAPIVFSSLQETPTPGYWKGIYFYNTAQDGQCVLSHCEVGYAGAGSIGSVYAYYCHPEISHTRIHHSSSYGIYAQSANIVASDNEIDHNTSYGCYLAYGAPDISGTNFHDNTNFDIYYQSPTGGAVTGNTIRSGIRLNAGAISAFTGNTVEINDSYPAQMLADQVGDFLTANTLTGITPNSYLEVYGTTITRDATWPAVLPLQVRSSVTVQGTDGDDGVTTLTIGAGTVIQFSQNLSLSIGAYSGNPGALVAVGTVAAPIVFTSVQASPAPGNWARVQFFTTADDATCVLENCIFEYGGAGSQGCLFSYNTPLTVRHCTFTNGSHAGLYLSGAGCTPSTIELSTFSDNIYGLYLSSSVQPTIVHNNFIGNSSYGLYNGSGGHVIAENNWWGSVDGPSGGDAVYGDVDYDPWHTETVTGDPSADISVAPESIIHGDSATLMWATTNASSVSIDPEIGGVGLSGNFSVAPGETTIYTITAIGLCGTATDMVTVTVFQVPTASMSADPTVVWGTSATLSWTTTDADTVEIDNGIGLVDAEGSLVVSPAVTTTYTLTATGAGGTVTAPVTVLVNPPPTVSISVDPGEIIIGESATLSWSTQNADTVEIDTGFGLVATEGSQEISPNTTTTYTLTATGPGGTETGSFTVTVRPLPAVTLSADPPTVWDSDTTLSWHTTDADTVSISPNIGVVDAAGSLITKPLGTTTYTITAANSWGAATDTVEVVNVLPPPDLEHGRFMDEQQGGAGLIGETIRLLNGNVVEYRTDLLFASPNSLGLPFRAAYNSQSGVVGGMGHGWVHTYETTLSPGFQIGGVAFVRIMDATGRCLYFIPTGEGAYKAAFNERSCLRLEAGEYIWERLDGMIHGFNTAGQLQWIGDGKGNRLALSYNAQGVLDTVTDQMSGRTLTFHYNQAGRILSVEGPATSAVSTGIWCTYDYDANGNLITVSYANGSGYRYLYEDTLNANLLTGKKDAANHLLASWGYNEGGLAAQSSDTEGRGVSIQYVDEDQVDVTDAYGTVRTYHMQTIAGRKRLSGMQGTVAPPYTDSQVVAWAYDHQMNLVETVTENGAVNQYLDFNPNGLPRAVKQAVGSAQERILSYAYHPHLGLPLNCTEASVIGAGDKVTIWDFDSDGDSEPNEAPTALVHRVVEKGYTLGVSAEVVSYEYVTTFGYDGLGQITFINGPLAGSDDTTTYAYDAGNGNLLSVTGPLVGATTFSLYDAAGQPGCIVDVNGQVTDFTYDARGRVVRTDYGADAGFATTVYNLAASPASTMDADGVVRHFAYDTVSGRLVSVSDADGNHIDYTYDSRGNVTESGHWKVTGEGPFYRKQFSYDSPEIPGRIYQVFTGEAAATAYHYNAAGNVSYVIDPELNRTDYTYDVYGRRETVVQPGGGVTTFDYDGHGNLISVMDAENKETIYTYDDMGRLVSTVSPDTGTTTYVYDAAGNQIRKTDATSVTVTYDHDALNRLTEVAFPDTTQNIGYTYDEGVYGKGFLTGMSDPSGSVQYGYDSRGRLTEKTTTVSGVDYTLSRQYSSAGRVIGLTYPTGRSVEYSRNAKGQIASVATSFGGNVTMLAANMAYLPLGSVTGWDSGAGGGVNNQASTCGCLTTANPGTDREKGYTYDGNRNLGAIEAAASPWQERTYTYDAQNRLSKVESLFGTTGFTYDKVGNILTRYEQFEDAVVGVLPGSPRAYTYMPGTDMLESVDGYEFRRLACQSGANSVVCSVLADKGVLSFSYDEAGRTISKVLDSLTVSQVAAYTYNQDGRLIKAERDGAVIGEYTYNGAGERMSKLVNGATTVFHYDFDGNIIAESNEAGAFSREYLYMGMNRLAMASTETGDVYYYLNDQLGTPYLMTDDTGAVVWMGKNDPFGGASVSSSSVLKNNFRFAGQYYDQETGLHYNYHRYYDPSIGRYLTADPIGLAGEINLYAYVQNNPVNFVDPFGLYTEVIVWAPVGHGKSAFGHISVNQNGTSYSFGPNGMDVRPASEFAQMNNFREGIGSVLNLSEQQEKILESSLNSPGEYGRIMNNCVNPVQKGLNAAGVDVGSSIFPVSLGNALIDSGSINNINFYSPQNGK